MKRILIASPVRGGVSPTYVKTLLALLFSKTNRIMGGPNAPYDFDWAATSGTSVAMARDELANVAITRKFDGLCFWDIDLGAFNSEVTLAMFHRLFSHDVDIVAGQYVGHNFLSQFHGATVEKAELRPDGLMEMAQIPLGFSYISTKALLKIKEAHPHHTYVLKETCMNRAKAGMFEFFPNGVVGPCSAEGKLARLNKIDYRMKLGGLAYTEDATRIINEVCEILNDTNYDTNIMLGEDFYFCKLARDAGLKLYIDNNLIIPHDTGIRLPVNNQDILTALGEEWRLENNAKPEDVKDLIEMLRPYLSKDIP